MKDTRGLRMDRSMLFVIGGSNGMAKATRPSARTDQAP